MSLQRLRSRSCPRVYVSLLPFDFCAGCQLLSVTRFYTWDPAILAPLSGMKLPLMAPAVKNVIGIWSLVIGLVLGIVLALALGFLKYSQRWWITEGFECRCHRLIAGHYEYGF